MFDFRSKKWYLHRVLCVFSVRWRNKNNKGGTIVVKCPRMNVPGIAMNAGLKQRTEKMLKLKQRRISVSWREMTCPGWRGTVKVAEIFEFLAWKKRKWYGANIAFNMDLNMVMNFIMNMVRIFALKLNMFCELVFLILKITKNSPNSKTFTEFKIEYGLWNLVEL